MYPDWEDLQAEYPELEKEDIRKALAFAARNLASQIIPIQKRPCELEKYLACHYIPVIGTNVPVGLITNQDLTPDLKHISKMKYFQDKKYGKL